MAQILFQRTVLSQPLRKKHLQQCLRQALLSQATIRGIGPALRQRLLSSGFRTAADINRRVLSVPGIGSWRYRKLLDWRRAVEQRATETQPKALPSQEAAALRTRYEAQRAALQDRRSCELQQMHSSELRIREKHQRELEDLKTRERAIQVQLEREIEQIRDQLRRRRIELENRLASVGQELKTSRLLAGLTHKIAVGRREAVRLA